MAPTLRPLSRILTVTRAVTITKGTRAMATQSQSQPIPTKPKRICIIGAGPAGLTTAKTLLHHFPPGTFHVTVFEQSSRIGGLWPSFPSSSGDPSSAEGPSSEGPSDENPSSEVEGMIHPHMSTNLSRWTVGFGDLAWDRGGTEGKEEGDEGGVFPKAWRVGRYLERYYGRYLVGREGVEVKLSTRVERVDRTEEGCGGWKVDIRSVGPRGMEGREGGAETETETLLFDHLVVASGFFGQPHVPTGLEEFKGVVQHSTRFRNVHALLKDTANPEVKNIVVVGGSMSGVEVAEDIAMQLSNETHRPGDSRIKDVEKYVVHHVLKKPLWVVPHYVPVKPLLSEKGEVPEVYDPAPHFLPVDLSFYNLAKRPPGPLKNQSGNISPEGARAINDSLRCTVGTDQSDLLPNLAPETTNPLAVQGKMLTDAPWIAINNHYPSFVRSGVIKPVTGTLASASGNTISISAPDGTSRTVPDVAALVLATGFDATPSLSFLPPSVLEKLGYNPSCPPLPLHLAVHSTIHPSVLDLGFVGFYRGPFWGVMEMQARFLGRSWSGEEELLERALSATPELGMQLEVIEKLRDVYKKDPKRLAQFPMGDYVFVMETFNDLLGIQKLEPATEIKPVLPASYSTFAVSMHDKDLSETAEQESERALSSAETALHNATSPTGSKWVPAAIFRSLHGRWTLSRRLVSALPSHPSGTFVGTAEFFPRSLTTAGSATSGGPQIEDPPREGGEYLYHEEGNFKTEGVVEMTFRAQRRYVYRYDEARDVLSAWFVKTSGAEGNLGVDYLFHELEIVPPPEYDGEADVGGRTRRGWRARASHLCVADTYDVEYEFFFRGAGLERWTLRYGVRGPKKSYWIEGEYTR